MSLSKRVALIKPSPTLSLEARAKAMKREGMDIVSFSAGEPDFDTPSGVKEAGINAIRDGFTKYTPTSGIEELRKAVAEIFRKKKGLVYRPDEILISCGAKHSLFNIAMTLFEEGDEVIIPAPYWVTYPEQILLTGARPVIVRTYERDDFLLTPDSLQKAITENTKGLILNTPSNPVGAVYRKEHLEKIAELAIRHNIYVISDETYSDIVYDGFNQVSIASLGQEIFNLSITVDGVSKSYAMTGWRIGFAAGPRDIIKAMGKVQSQSTSNPASISQKAALEALTGNYREFIAGMVEKFDERRRYIVSRLNSIEGITCFMPKGAFYVFPDISGVLEKIGIDSSIKFSEYLLNKVKVAVVPGEAFGTPGYIRLSYAICRKEIEKGLDRIEKGIKNIIIGGV